MTAPTEAPVAEPPRENPRARPTPATSSVPSPPRTKRRAVAVPALLTIPLLALGASQGGWLLYAALAGSTALAGGAYVAHRRRKAQQQQGKKPSAGKTAARPQRATPARPQTAPRGFLPRAAAAGRAASGGARRAGGAARSTAGRAAGGARTAGRRAVSGARGAATKLGMPTRRTNKTPGPVGASRTGRDKARAALRMPGRSSTPRTAKATTPGRGPLSGGKAGAGRAGGRRSSGGGVLSRLGGGRSGRSSGATGRTSRGGQRGGRLAAMTRRVTGQRTATGQGRTAGHLTRRGRALLARTRRRLTGQRPPATKTGQGPKTTPDNTTPPTRTRRALRRAATLALAGPLARRGRAFLTQLAGQRTPATAAGTPTRTRRVLRRVTTLGADGAGLTRRQVGRATHALRRRIWNTPAAFTGPQSGIPVTPVTATTSPPALAVAFSDPDALAPAPLAPPLEDPAMSHPAVAPTVDAANGLAAYDFRHLKDIERFTSAAPESISSLAAAYATIGNKLSETPAGAAVAEVYTQIAASLSAAAATAEEAPGMLAAANRPDFDRLDSPRPNEAMADFGPNAAG